MMLKEVLEDNSESLGQKCLLIISSVLDSVAGNENMAGISQAEVLLSKTHISEFIKIGEI